MIAWATSDLALLVACLPGLLGSWLTRSDRRRFALTLLATLVLTLVLQVLIARPRPFGSALVVSGVPFWSFPSGHAALMGAAATYFAVRTRRPVHRWALVVLAVAGSALRVAAELHHPTDVGGGLVLGAGMGLLGARAGRDRRPAWSWGLAPSLGVMIVMKIFALVPLGSVEDLFFAGADKPLHFLVFGTLGFFAAGWSTRRPLRTIAVLSVLAGLEELSQAFQPGRSLDPMDALMSMSGLLGFGALGAWLARRGSGQGGASRFGRVEPGEGDGISGVHEPAGTPRATAGSRA